ncbi:XRE family transcriptional regulator [Ochrobactrum chromiisoli]|uniref:Helix-turn-helix domain-containing protein n=1 Tax=Ochrobactrum chromiisoli TaxID=2993941 RepID=A0ABT3QN53_9HYPH|nr:S24 family peptidase [Ochrobactrum chromiisoli]MCX2697043.1 helix-turn-helix domain-containing protein [Ochrobactrum chromiisoli]
MAKPENPSKTELGARIRLIRKELGDVEREVFATDLGISKNTLAYYERGERTPDATTLAAYRDRFGININWLVAGEGPMRSESTNAFESNGKDTETKLTQVSPDMISLQRYDIQAAAGDGIIPVGENGEDSGISIARSFLRRIGAHPNSCVLLESKGDSMLPSIPGGSLLVVDRSKTEIEDDMVFVFRVGPGIKVKRAVWRIDGNLDLVSDNDKYPPETYGPDRADEIAPIGRVMLILREP